MKIRDRAVGAYRELLEAWNQRDAEAFSNLFTPDGVSIGFDGSEMAGQEEIRESLEAIFADHPTAAYVAKIRNVRALDSSVVLLRAVVGMVPPGGKELNPAANAAQSVLFTLSSGKPQIVHFHNTPTAYHGRPHLVERLTSELGAVVRQGEMLEDDGRDPEGGSE